MRIHLSSVCVYLFFRDVVSLFLSLFFLSRVCELVSVRVYVIGIMFNKEAGLITRRDDVIVIFGIFLEDCMIPARFCIYFEVVSLFS